MKDFFKPLNSSIELFQEKINFLFFMIEILLLLIIVILIKTLQTLFDGKLNYIPDIQTKI